MATYSVADPVTFVSAISETNSYTVPANRFAIVNLSGSTSTSAVRSIRIDGTNALTFSGSSSDSNTLTGVYLGPGSTVSVSNSSQFVVRISGCLFKNSTAS